MWSWIGHNAIISGMENIQQSFMKLGREKYFIPIDTSERKQGYYTWMGLSDFLSLYFKNYGQSRIRKLFKTNQIYKSTNPKSIM